MALTRSRSSTRGRGRGHIDAATPLPGSAPASRRRRRRSSSCGTRPWSTRAATSRSSASRSTSSAASSSFVVGPTGCGKSTLIKLLIRELEPANGEIVRSPATTSTSSPMSKVPLPAPPDRHRLPGLQAAPEPHRLRQRRLRAAGDRRAALRDPAQGPRDPPPGRAPGEDPQLPRRALGRRAAARLDRPRVRQPPAAAARRRADRQPRPRDLDRDHAAALPDQPHRHDRPRRHPRPRDGRQDAPPRDRAGGGPPRPRRGRRRLPRRVDDASSRSACTPRWASEPGADSDDEPTD